MPPQVWICPLKKLYQLLDVCSEGVAAVISTSWDMPDPARLHGIPYVCRQYRDIDFDGPGAFSREDAEAFATFIRYVAQDPHIHTIYVCCDAAVSRSPGVYAAIARHWTGHQNVFENPQYSPNFRVFRLLAEALGHPVSDLECDTLLHTSRKVFRNAINGTRKI